MVTAYGLGAGDRADVCLLGVETIVAAGLVAVIRGGARQADAIIYLEQTAPGRFVRHSLEKVSCDRVTCAAGDIFATGKMDFVTGNFGAGTAEHAITIWKNLGPVKK